MRETLFERRATQEKESLKNKRSPAQLRRDLEKQILQDRSYRDKSLNSEIPYISTFTDRYCVAGTQRLFIKGASKDSRYT